ncbi:diguanylate cyclase [Acetobacterium paludosum]|uniref:Diguanylate cyclase n=1 Tax=Acetobacterium paludosum TaxID=52693 RepID=A0A923KR65_9FIRM|nr:GGDEF domain-containing protein [Acetobacterium paludosum]MBC3886927.1 diguanylate cyclase [Acetobacterium paludosum]
MSNNLKSNKKLMILITAFMIGFILFVIVGYKTIINIKINGEMYNEIMSGKELVADVLPPPGYIIESYLVTLQLAKETDTAKIEELISEEAQLEKDYMACHDLWSSRLPEGDLKANMVENAYQPAMEFYEVFESEFIPAIRSGDQVKANEIVTGKLEPLYTEHRHDIDQVVSIANNENSMLEDRAGKMLEFNTFILIILATAVLVTVIIYCVGIIGNEKLKKMSLFDGLTGTANRRYFDQVLIQEIGQAKRDKNPLSLILIDVDYYKEYNDMYGHTKGDDCLRRVATTVKMNLRRPGDFLARYGGDEFVLVLPNTNEAGSALVAERLRAGVEKLCIDHVNSFCSDYVTLSIGVVTASQEEILVPDDLISAADRALYQSKIDGRNRVSVGSLK